MPETVRASWSQLGTRCRSESQRQTEGFGPSVTHCWATPAKMRKKCCYGQKNLGQYVVVCPCLQLTSHGQEIHPFENKVWEIYFYKEVCSFVHWSSSLLLTMFQQIFVYVYVCGYTTRGCTTWTLIKHIEKTLNGSYTRMLRAVMNKSWRQQPLKQQP